jgi:hypothetical protein
VRDRRERVGEAERTRVGHKSKQRLSRITGLGALEQRSDRNPKDTRKLDQPSCADTVGANFVFLKLLECHPELACSPEKGDQYTFVALASTSRAIIAYRTGKRDTGTTQKFIADLRERVLGAPEISTASCHISRRSARTSATAIMA